MKKILIWDLAIRLSNSGGPGGYLYNIHEYLKDNPNSQIVFISDFLNKDNSTIASNVEKGKLKTILLKSFLGKLLSEIKSIYNLYYKKSPVRYIFDLNQFSFIHFHSIFDLQNNTKYLKGYNGKVVLTSHTPEPPFNEILQTYIYHKSLFKLLNNHLTRREIKIAKNYVDLWLFPTRTAMEPYVSNSNLYREYFEQNIEKLVFVPSAILDDNTEREDNYFAKFGIPDESFNIVYVGRHNEVKGYGELKEIAKKVLNNNPKVHFIIAGKEEPLKRLDHDRWHELGWINYSSKLIKNADLFILPNKQTYFDLVALEVLRAGTPLLLTYTGGNKYFVDDLDNEETKGIYSYKSGDVNGAYKCIEDIIKKKEHNLGLNNRKLWENHFKLERYIRDYLNFVNGEK